MCRAAAKEPWLLTATPAAVQPKLDMLTLVWPLGRPQVVALALQHPHLLTSSYESISSKLSSLSQVRGFCRYVILHARHQSRLHLISR